jgi:hypothetical protein
LLPSSGMPARSFKLVIDGRMAQEFSEVWKVLKYAAATQEARLQWCQLREVHPVPPPLIPDFGDFWSLPAGFAQIIRDIMQGSPSSNMMATWVSSGIGKHSSSSGRIGQMRIGVKIGRITYTPMVSVRRSSNAQRSTTVSNQKLRTMGRVKARVRTAVPEMVFLLPSRTQGRQVRGDH